MRLRHTQGAEQPDPWGGSAEDNIVRDSVAARPSLHEANSVLCSVQPLKGNNTVVTGNLEVCLLLAGNFESFIVSAALCSHLVALFLKLGYLFRGFLKNVIHFWSSHGFLLQTLLLIAWFHFLFVHLNLRTLYI